MNSEFSPFLRVVKVKAMQAIRLTRANYGLRNRFISQCQVTSLLSLRNTFDTLKFRQERSYTTCEKEPITPLAKNIMSVIQDSGPMSVARFMRHVLTNPHQGDVGGYYMKGDVFGSKGDFITSPEISQMFGELVGVWFLTQWYALGLPKKTRIVELGPGRGTLMEDMLRGLSNFKDFYQTIQSVHMVEASPGLRKMQHQKLCSKSLDDEKTLSVAHKKSQRSDGLEVHWHDHFEELINEDGVFTIVVAHEFFDALPIYKFERTKKGWRELMVDIDDSTESPYHFKSIISPAATPASNALTKDPAYNRYEVGDRIELSPDSWRIVHQIAKQIRTSSGSALIMDYGQDYTQFDTLRGIRKHQFTNAFSMPGETDLSADVDFSYLKDAAREFGK
ncbi:hypothetical protein K7432_003953 [Basidiobolus ranarum]|uniref:Protein arginine methyltransferase NDUFAF7 n=1 Tax=Basidiobolus ranarum TaxID=34480 RepID=A0ABR2W5M1_9FUNG